MLDLLALTRRALGSTPRHVPSRLIRPAPSWASAGSDEDALAIGARVFREGYLTSGYVVQASRFLFEPGDLPGSAVVVHATGRESVVSMDRLVRIGSEIVTLTSRHPQDPEQASVAAQLAEGARLVRFPVPGAVARGAPVALSTVEVRAADLPGRHMRAWFLPLLAHDELPSVIALPRGLWARDLWLAWDDLAAEAIEEEA